MTRQSWRWDAFRSTFGLGALGIAAAVVAACGTVPPESPGVPSPFAVSASPSGSPAGRQTASATASSPSPAITVGELRLSCGGPLTFTTDDLLAAPGAEGMQHPAAEPLRALMESDQLPNRSGWRLVALTDDRAFFLLPALPAEGVAFWYAEVEAGAQADSAWQTGPFGQCDPMPRFEGLSAARWELAADADLRPESQVVRVLVFELACASGRSPEGRIAPAAIDYGDDSVTIVLGTRPPAGPAGPQTCQGSPPAVFSIELREPIGNRMLLDGSVFPPEPRGGAAP